MNNEQFKSWLQSYHESLGASDYQPPLIMGILNLTPDSFSADGHYFSQENALAHARRLIAAGADVIDIGGESTRPGAKAVTVEEELARVIPVIELLRQESSICLSIDTSRAEVMRAAIAAGANWINDVRALQWEYALSTAVDLAVPVCLMHAQGSPATMQDNPTYAQFIIDEINQFFVAQIKRCVTAGIKRTHLILDPGFGYGKSVTHNLLLLKHLAEFSRHQLPILLGVSRKSTLGAVVNKPVSERVVAGLAASVFASVQGGVALLRTHDVDETKQALTMIQAIYTPPI